jgi:WD40 repeat protein
MARRILLNSLAVWGLIQGFLSPLTAAEPVPGWPKPREILGDDDYPVLLGSPDTRTHVSFRTGGSYRKGNKLLAYTATTGEVVARLEVNHRWDIAVFSPDSKRLALAAGPFFRVVGLDNAKCPETVLEAPAQINDIAFTLDGRLIVVAYGNVCGLSRSRQGGVKVFDAQTGKIVGPGWDLTGAAAYMLEFAEDGRLFSAAADDGAVKLFDRAGQPSATTVQVTRPGSTLKDMDLSANSRWLVTTSIDETILWDLEGEKPTKTSLWESGGNRVLFAPDCKRVVGLDDSDGCKVWEVPSGKLLIGPFGKKEKAEDGGLAGMRICTGGCWLVLWTCSNSGEQLRVWDLNSGRPAGPLIPSQPALKGVTSSQDGKYAVTGESGISFGLGQHRLDLLGKNDDAPPQLWHAIDGKRLDSQVKNSGRWVRPASRYYMPGMNSTYRSWQTVGYADPFGGR